ncbi:MAG TPA: YdeI/OmpD-associated family protein [Bacteroidia bacterium]|jgi:uncharacterized protein YdeI (YjbR/CyaY-like superfamily)|nr:YdeI/OmpD-associated family protein [Bacteroidia bacterium]
MATNKLNPKVDWFFTKPTRWQEEYGKLRTIALDSGLTEDLKWGCPCYTTSDGKNIVLIHGFKDYCAYLLFKGSLMKDESGILIQQTPNVQVPRQIRFTNTKEITKLASTLKAYIKEAIELEKAGVKATLKKASEYKVPEEFQNKLNENAALKKAFYALTPGRQRGYLYNFSQPKLAKTRVERVEKYTPKILNGKGIDD